MNPLDDDLSGLNFDKFDLVELDAGISNLEQDLTSGILRPGSKDPKCSGLEAMEDNLYRAYKTKIPRVIERISQVGLPRPGEQYRLVTRRSFNAIELLAYIVQREPVEELRMAVYSINYYAALHLVEMIDRGKIHRAEILMSNLRNTAHREKEQIICDLFAGHPKIGLFFCSSHAKIMSCRTIAGNHYTIEGSGNHAFNSRVEQYVIDNDPSIFDFTCQWMAEIRDYLAGTGELEVCP